MNARTNDSIDRASSYASGWAKSVADNNPRKRSRADLRWIYENVEPHAGDHLRRAMATLEFPLWVVAFVHYRSDGDLRSKVSESCDVAGVEMSRRNYYDRLDRVHYFVAGFACGYPTRASHD